MKELRLFEFMYRDGERDWVAAYTLIEAMQIQQRDAGIELHEYDPLDDVREVPKEEWGEIKFELSTGRSRSILFEMKSIDKPRIIATSIW